MFKVSDEYMNAVQDTSREWDIKLRCTLADATVLEFTKDNVVGGSFKYTEASTCSNTIQIGSTYSNSCSFKLVNNEHELDKYSLYKAKVQPSIGLYIPSSGKFEYVPLGDFYILDPVKTFSTISITCFDNMSLANEIFDTSNLAFPMSANKLFDIVIQQLGCSVATSLKQSVATLTEDIHSLPTKNYSCRDVLAGFGIMLGKNLRFNRAGELEDFWYSQTGQTTSRDTRVGESKYTSDLVKITGVYLEDAYGNTFSAGTEEYAVELPTSPIMQGSEMCVPILERLLEQLQSLQYFPATVSWIGNPATQAGDLIEHKDSPLGATVVCPIMKISYEFAGTETIESLGVEPVSNSQESATDKKLKQAFVKSEKDKVELNSKIDQSGAEILLSVSKKYATKEETASIKTSVDTVKLTVDSTDKKVDSVEKSVTELAVETNKVQIDVSNIVENGPSKITTKMGYTFDDDGLQVSASGDSAHSKIDNTGLYVDVNGDNKLTANKNGVDATDVTVHNYLIVGEHARWEKFTRGSDSNRVACFFI